MAKTLLETMLKEDAVQARAESPEQLRTLARRTYLRDLATIGITGPTAELIVRRTLSALERLFDDADLDLDTMAGAALVAERTLVAVASTLLALVAAAGDAEAVHGPWPPQTSD